MDRDASQHTIGVVLSQLDEQGKEISLAFASKTLCPRQWYCAMKRELYAIVYCGISSVARVVPGLVIRMDHTALRWLMSFTLNDTLYSIP